MADIEVRPATVADAADMLAIYAPYVRDTAITFEIDVPELDQFAQRIETTLQRFPWLAAVMDGAVVGYAYAGPLKQRAAYAHSVEVSVYVARSARGLGIGRALYQQLEDALKAQGIRNAYACITCTDDAADPYLTDASIRFHEHMGYARVGLFHRCGEKFGRPYSVTWMEKFLVQ